MTIARFFLIASLTLFFCGCLAQTPTASKQDDLEAKQFRIDNGKSYIYIVWPSGLAGGALALEINVNGKIIGKISRGKYYLVVSEPKETNFVAALPLDKLSPPPPITYFSCQSNRCKYLEGNIQWGAVMLFRELDDEKGEKIINSSSLIRKIVLE